MSTIVVKISHPCIGCKDKARRYLKKYPGVTQVQSSPDYDNADITVTGDYIAAHLLVEYLRKKMKAGVELVSDESASVADDPPQEENPPPPPPPPQPHHESPPPTPPHHTSGGGGGGGGGGILDKVLALWGKFRG